jgi:hypothetical protein
MSGMVAAMSACALDTASPEAEPATGSQSQAFAGGQCDGDGCGANSPVVDTRRGFHDLNLVGRPRLPSTFPNTAGLAITIGGEARRAQIVKANRSYDLSVVDGRFVGTCAGCPTLKDMALVGATITLTLDGPNGPVPRFVVTINSVREIPYWLGSGRTASYTLLWRDVAGGPTTNLCSKIKLLEELIAEQGGESDFADQELMGMRTFESVVYEGDRVDRDHKTMQVNADDNWFNIGCASHALAKLRLTHNTVHSQPGGLPQAWERRQATFKLLAADYCGGGTPLTVAGQRLVWQGDLMAYADAPLEIEARWDENGATCLYAPRMLYPTSQFGSSTFPLIWDSIAAACAAVRKPVPPPCTNLDPFDYDGMLRVSSNPRI